MDFLNFIKDGFIATCKVVYDYDVNPASIIISPTKKEFEGDYTVVIFPYVKDLRAKPEEVGDKIGSAMVAQLDHIKASNTIKGFLNLTLTDQFWVEQLQKIGTQQSYGHHPRRNESVMVEFASPNTNKPLHLGHIRNILLGWSCSQILDAAGYDIVKVQVVNDRGIAICKSMLAWQLFGNGATPSSEQLKADHFVGDYYVLFEQKFQEEYSQWQHSDAGSTVYTSKMKEGQSRETFFKEYKNTYFNEYSSLGRQAKDMLLAWEDGDSATLDLWNKMNSWVYEGFDATYEKLGVDFDKLYFESDTYLLGKKTVEEGLAKGIFYQKEDNSVWVDLEDVGMDQKIVLRSDGTAVYITQDIGTAMKRYEDYKVSKIIYTVADEQDYHFKVLFEILKRFEEPYADGLHHLSYGMVDLTTGRMKSREGTVVDADDLIEEVINEAWEATRERGDIAELDQADQKEIVRRIGMAALKFFIIKVNPKKRMTFDPQESLDMQGQTGPYVQNAYVRIQSVLRKNKASVVTNVGEYTALKEAEKNLLKLVLEYPSIIDEAANTYDPSSVANFAYALAKEFHRFYHEVRILNAETEAAKDFRLALCQMVAYTLADSMNLLGIEMPDRM